MSLCLDFRSPNSKRGDQSTTEFFLFLGCHQFSPNSNALAYLIRVLAVAFDHLIADVHIVLDPFGIGSHPPGVYSLGALTFLQRWRIRV
jgi:hypothetical protein